MLKLFILREIQEIEAKKPVIAFTSGEYEKIKKKSTAKLKFNKKWFISNFSGIYENHSEVFENLEINGSADAIYREYLVKKNKFVKNGEEFYNFINQLFIDMTVPKQIMMLDEN